MTYLLDTNAVISLINKRDNSIISMVERHRRDEVGTSSIVIHELCFGAYKSETPAKNLEVVGRIALKVLDFDREDAREAGRIRALLAKQGTPIGPYDSLIAGQALARGLIVVTHNVREFTRVPGLKLEDWQA